MLLGRVWNGHGAGGRRTGGWVVGRGRSFGAVTGLVVVDVDVAGRARWRAGGGVALAARWARVSFLSSDALEL